MRVTNRMMVDNAIKYMNDNLERLSKFQERISSGKKIQSASDDPATAQAVLSLHSSLEAGKAYLDSALMAADRLDANELALKQMSDLVKRSIELASGGLSDTNSAVERRALATEVDSLLRTAVDIGNSTHASSYIFSGFRTSTKPFTLNSGPPDSVSYAGDAGVMQLSIGPGQKVTVNIDGSSTFSPLFAALIDVRDALNANDTSALQVVFGALTTAHDNLNQARTTNGARKRDLEASVERIESTQLALKSLLSQKEDADLTEAISMLRHQETIYQAVLETGRRTIGLPSLFDFLG